MFNFRANMKRYVKPALLLAIPLFLVACSAFKNKSCDCPKWSKVEKAPATTSEVELVSDTCLRPC